MTVGFRAQGSSDVERVPAMTPTCPQAKKEVTFLVID